MSFPVPPTLHFQGPPRILTFLGLCIWPQPLLGTLHWPNRNSSFAGQRQQLTQTQVRRAQLAGCKGAWYSLPYTCRGSIAGQGSADSQPSSEKPEKGHWPQWSSADFLLFNPSFACNGKMALFFSDTSQHVIADWTSPADLGQVEKQSLCFSFFPPHYFLCTQVTEAHTAYVLGTNGPCMQAKSHQSCPTFCNPMDCSLARVPWDFPGKNTGVGYIPFSRGSSQPRDRTQVSYISCTGRWVLYH